MSDRAVPNLPSRNFDDTIAFYEGSDSGWLIGTMAG